MLVGIAERCLQLSVDHASSREQFGRPIGVHQAIKHPIADMAVRAEAAWPEVLVAAVAADEQRADARFHALSARITAADAAEANATRTVQTMGGMGFTFEHDAHLLVKRALVLRSTLGGDHELLAELLAEPAAV
jgi:alkylation response protein AidB-like acyl-CoA dehydrogenase